ncbi:hypothetical protein RZS08_48325, partial [Arthrospira platensis SPKY1]|nr:hypothetical protein [Arthrospira platensis SPKY1]
GQPSTVTHEMVYEQQGDGSISALMELTALATLIIARMACELAKDTKVEGGFYPPEQLLDGALFLEEMHKSGLQLHRFEA